MTANPTLLSMPLAQNGQKNVIPETQATAGNGLFRQSTGFPAETSLPLGAGGVAPSREDFNGMANLLGGVAFMAQKGFTFNYDATQDYYTGCIVIDPTDGKRYECIADMPASNTIAPHSDTGNTYWQEVILGGAGGGFNTREEITTSGTWTAPITGVYRVTCIGGGGAGGNGGNTGQGGKAGTQGGTTSFGGYVSAAGGHSGGGGGSSAEGGGGAAGAVVTDFVSLTEGDSISIAIGAGGVAPSSGTSGSVNGEDGSGGAKGGVQSKGGQGAQSSYGSGNSGANYVLVSSATFGTVCPGAIGGSNGTPYGGGGGGARGSYTAYYPNYSASGGGNGQAGATITANNTPNPPKGGDGGNGAVVIEYFKKEE